MKVARAVLGTVVCLGAAGAARAEVTLHCTFDDEQAIASPAVAKTEKPMSMWTTGTGRILFEDGLVGKAARLHGSQRNNELITISPKALEFTKSGRMDFWIKFNADPHKVKEEYYIFCDSAWPINFQMEVIPYDRPNNAKCEAAYGVWLGARERGRDKQLYNWSSDRYHRGGPFSKIKPGEWVRITLVWIKNEGKDQVPPPQQLGPRTVIDVAGQLREIGLGKTRKRANSNTSGPLAPSRS